MYVVAADGTPLHHDGRARPSTFAQHLPWYYVLEFAPRLSATNTSILLTACVLCAPLRDFLLL